MNRWKAALKKLLRPGGGWAALAILLGGGSLALTFLVFGDGSPFAYVSYLLSAYGLAVLAAAIAPLVSSVRRFLHSIPLAHRYLTDQHFSVWCGLVLSFAINLGFAALKLAYAAVCASFWDGWLAVYHLLPGDGHDRPVWRGSSGFPAGHDLRHRLRCLASNLPEPCVR